jgi:hypothetical protein
MMRFRLLGPLEIRAGGDWRGIGAPKWRSVLAALLIHPGQIVSADALINEVWGDAPPARAANLISIYVLRLRRPTRPAADTELENSPHAVGQRGQELHRRRWVRSEGQVGIDPGPGLAHEGGIIEAGHDTDQTRSPQRDSAGLAVFAWSARARVLGYTSNAHCTLR